MLTKLVALCAALLLVVAGSVVAVGGPISGDAVAVCSHGCCPDGDCCAGGPCPHGCCPGPCCSAEAKADCCAEGAPCCADGACCAK